MAPEAISGQGHRTLGVMRIFPCLFMFATSQSFSCEPTDIPDIPDIRRDVEIAFKDKSMTALVGKYGGAVPVQIRRLHFYDDESPLTILRFDNLLALATWFDDTHKHASSMFVPDKGTCGEFECRYELPEFTLHHGTYLMGFETARIEHCTYLTEVSFSWE
jgi:hypothetical protein